MLPNFIFVKLHSVEQYFLVYIVRLQSVILILILSAELLYYMGPMYIIT